MSFVYRVARASRARAMRICECTHHEWSSMPSSAANTKIDKMNSRARPGFDRIVRDRVRRMARAALAPFGAARLRSAIAADGRPAERREEMVDEARQPKAEASLPRFHRAVSPVA